MRRWSQINSDKGNGIILPPIFFHFYVRPNTGGIKPNRLNGQLHQNFSHGPGIHGCKVIQAYICCQSSSCRDQNNVGLLLSGDGLRPPLESFNHCVTLIRESVKPVSIVQLFVYLLYVCFPYMKSGICTLRALGKRWCSYFLIIQLLRPCQLNDNTFAAHCLNEQTTVYGLFNQSYAIAGMDSDIGP